MERADKWVLNKIYKAAKIALKICLREIGYTVECIQECVSREIMKKPSKLKNKQEPPVEIWNELTTDERAEVVIIYIITGGLAILTWIELGIKIFVQ